MISQSSTQVLNQIENNVKKSKSIIENKKITFQNNYLNRVDVYKRQPELPIVQPVPAQTNTWVLFAGIL